MRWLDNLITKRAGRVTEEEIYRARWVWYHTILAAELFLIIILLIGIIIKV